jgi:hypothetical protein
MLALWAVVGICARKGLPLPPGLRSRFLKIANKLLQHAANDTPRARELVADIVLDTKNESGGPSPFNEYRIEKRDADIIARVRELLMRDLEDLSSKRKTLPGKKEKTKKNQGSSKSRATRENEPEALALPVIRSHTAIYKEVAEEYGVEPETVKRLFERDEREAGPFSYRIIRENRDEFGIIDI